MVYQTIKEVKGAYRLSWEKEPDDGSVSLLRERWTGGDYDFEDVVAIKPVDIAFVEAFLGMAKKLNLGPITANLKSGCGERVFFVELAKDQLNLTVELDDEFDCGLDLSLQDWAEIAPTIAEALAGGAD
jgi:hypothetical protein